jgi:hypothetical protein
MITYRLPACFVGFDPPALPVEDFPVSPPPQPVKLSAAMTQTIIANDLIDRLIRLTELSIVVSQLLNR